LWNRPESLFIGIVIARNEAIRLRFEVALFINISTPFLAVALTLLEH
jgi:hypothetical protein